MPLDRSTPLQYGANSAQDAIAITPSDTVDTTALCRGLFVGGAGAVSLVTLAGNTVAFTGLTAGSVLPVMFSRVNATGTTATLLVGLV